MISICSFGGEPKLVLDLDFGKDYFVSELFFRVCVCAHTHTRMSPQILKGNVLVVTRHCGNSKDWQLLDQIPPLAPFAGRLTWCAAPFLKVDIHFICCSSSSSFTCGSALQQHRLNIALLSCFQLTVLFSNFLSCINLTSIIIIIHFI